jgi:hypothetical protein
MVSHFLTPFLDQQNEIHLLEQLNEDYQYEIHRLQNLINDLHIENDKLRGRMTFQIYCAITMSQQH